MIRYVTNPFRQYSLYSADRRLRCDAAPLVVGAEDIGRIEAPAVTESNRSIAVVSR